MKSFSQEVRMELMRLVAPASHCNLAELAAIIDGSGEIVTQFPEDKKNCPTYQIRIRTENGAVARKCLTLLKKAFNIRADVSVLVHKKENQKRRQKDRIYCIQVNDDKEARRLLTRLHRFDNADILVEQPCCKRAYLRGAFLCAGSISNPEKSYHFEIVVPDKEKAIWLQNLIRPFGPEARIVLRKNHYVLYIKEGAQIVDMLNIMGAHVALMNLENIRIVREMRNTVNRKVNCEAANINKTVNAAVRQLEDIRCLRDRKCFNQLPEALLEMATLRLANPDASLTELGQMLNPPIGKSGVNHRLRKLSQLAEQVRKDSEMPDQ